jgi:alkanesulfonate monooxygenase SsuD/methylene tetrahydromethanopterin reductase-like flavin-dependent oxidoreductase (luciferase family)
VARYADEWNLPGATPERFREKRAVLERHCAALGRDPATIARSAMVGFIAGDGPAMLRTHAAAVQRYVPRLAGLATDDVPAAVRANGWLAGTPDDLIAGLRALADAGVQRVMLQHFDQTNMDVLALIAREVLPAVA